MNHLNSTLIEGVMIEKPVLRTLDEGQDKGKSVCHFTIATDRYRKRKTGIEKVTYHFDVEAWDYLAEVCVNKGQKGCNIRVVGQLKEERSTGSDSRLYSNVIIEAEHIEFRSSFKSEKKEVSSESV
jgi:single-strand DNA-binding protein